MRIAIDRPVEGSVAEELFYLNVDDEADPDWLLPQSVHVKNFVTIEELVSFLSEYEYHAVALQGYRTAAGEILPWIEAAGDDQVHPGYD